MKEDLDCKLETVEDGAYLRYSAALAQPAPQVGSAVVAGLV